MEQPKSINDKELDKGIEFKDSVDALDHYMNNEIGVKTLGRFEIDNKQDGVGISDELLQENLQNFISGLQGVLQSIEDGSLNENENIDRYIIEEFMDEVSVILETKDIIALRSLYERYRSLRGLDKK